MTTHSSGLQIPPIIVLVRPQMGENIGASARAMANFGLKQLRIVNPRDGWPNSAAISTSAGAFDVLEEVSVHATLASALVDCHHVVATSARRRRSLTPPSTLTSVLESRLNRHEDKHAEEGEAWGILFGAERSGLDSDEVSLASELVEISVAPEFSSLNLSSAVTVVAYQWRCSMIAAGKLLAPLDDDAIAPRYIADAASPTHDEWLGMVNALSDLLDSAGFWFPPEKRRSMERNFRAMMHRTKLNRRDIRTARGMISLLHRTVASATDSVSAGEENNDQDRR